MRKILKKRLGVAGVICIATFCIAFGYVEFFTKGVERLPEKPCAGAVDRDLAVRVLPSSRKAEERGKLTTSSAGLNAFTYWCYVRAGDSLISGEAEAGVLTPGGWQEFERSRSPRTSVSANGIHAFSSRDDPTVAWVYVPCTPPSHVGDRDAAHSLVTEARTLGDTRARGEELRQIVVDFAYQLARHAYEAGECREPREFPVELPRIGTGVSGSDRAVRKERHPWHGTNGSS
ncbi:hypothetical protein [Streptomyces termitum]|uniref:hypothetical protein n=1 Tax=Streptomyces termitum TaxID=67368 RepID=UPI0037988749